LEVEKQWLDLQRNQGSRVITDILHALARMCEHQFSYKHQR
jgi:hypothetical protein